MSTETTVPVVPRKEKISDLLRAGHPPTRIAEMLDIPRSAVMQYLALLAGEGSIYRSDILLSIPRATREIVEKLFADLGQPSAREILDAVEKSPEPTDLDDLITYLDLRDSVLADMYDLIRRIELVLHGHIKRALIREFGHDQEAWWREGLPASIRANCAAMRETDPDPAAEPFCYTTFIQLKEIFEYQWDLLSGVLPKDLVINRKEFRAAMDRLNSIRNSVMHPVRNSRLNDDDFAFVEHFHKSLRLDRDFKRPAPAINTDADPLPLP